MSKHVTALRAAIEPYRDKAWADHDAAIARGAHEMEARLAHEVAAYERILALIPPDAILIDPTAPETVAALAEALLDESDSFNEKWAAARAATILPAFVARLRGET